MFSDSIEGAKTIEVQASFDYEKTFDYTGDVQTYTVPRTGYYYIEMAGAQGGSTPTNYEGGAGAKASGYINLKAGENRLYILSARS